MAKPEISYYNSLCICTFCHRADYHKFRWLNHYLTVSRSHKAELKVGFIWGLWSSSNFMFVSRINGRRKWQPTPVLLPGKSHGWRSLVGYSPWGLKESDLTKWLHFHFSLSCIGEGNGNPLQCSCLENPRDGGAWWAAVYGVAQNRTQLKRLSSSSNRINSH